MAPSTASLKKAVQIRMAKSGLALVRTEPRTRNADVLFTRSEVEQLDRDLAGLPLNPQDFEIWTSAAAVREYLKDERIDFYHRLVRSAAELGVALEGKSVLDIGTCSGYLLRVIESKYTGVKLTGTDYYEECVRLSAALVPNATVFEAAVDDLKTTTERFDVIFCTEVIEHILDTETTIPTMLSLLNPGGALMVTVPNGSHDITPALTSEDGNSFGGHVNFWSRQSWEFYINRVTGERTVKFGSLPVNFDDDALFAIIFRD